MKTIKANELRIGNFVEIDQYPNSRVLIQIENGECIDQSIKLNCRAIPLTEEWLIKFRFVKRNSLSSILYSNNAKFSIYLTPPIDTNDKWNILGIEKDLNIKYVHELQNLYFYLTKKELTIK